MSTPVDDVPLARERSHLASSRAALSAMRESVESLDISDVTANWVNAEVLAHQIGERIKALADLSDTPLFFGRLDYLHEPGAEEAEGAPGETFYIGKPRYKPYKDAPIKLQAHGDASAPISFRNIWVRKLD